MKLPNADRAEADLRKLSEYCLSAEHPVGKHKAVVFQAALGLTAADAAQLRTWVLQAAVDADATLERTDAFGTRYRMDFEVSTTLGRATIRSAWIVRTGEAVPRLTTCYVLSQ
jgi:hypothetical protein